MVFIRKALDKVFTEEELYYLDDIMTPFEIPRETKRIEHWTGNKPVDWRFF